MPYTNVDYAEYRDEASTFVRCWNSSLSDRILAYEEGFCFMQITAYELPKQSS